MKNSQYRLPDDVKPKKQRDYFFVMRKGICFLMFLLLLVTIGVFVLSYLNLEVVPKQYISLANEEVISEDTGETVTNYYSVLDPVFGVIKKVTGDFMDEAIVLGDSPLYDDMMAKVEIMDDQVLKILMTYSPILLLMYVIIAIVMFFKAFFGMFGKRIFKKFGLGSILMILSVVAVAFSLLAFVTEVGTEMEIAKIVDIIIGSFKEGTTGLIGGYGLLGLLGLPVITLIFSMFAKKKVPYSIFDV